ncbi:hypothetical protein ANCDUO_00554 [Ancylostoma duodenale]|uniref:Uncharacterized protein n=1 Tax=Ancylostoma duodenale TaxID=51022 RepID=A0A0C2E183_9BILA|nr:hypothetical protein ANCDUO_00554 [Ancylostoma duodenale]
MRELDLGAPEGTSNIRSSEILQEIQKMAVKVKRMDAVVYEKLYRPPEESVTLLMKEMEDRLNEKLQALLGSIHLKLDRTAEEWEKKVELIIYAQINTVVQLKEAQKPKKEAQVPEKAARAPEKKHGEKKRRSDREEDPSSKRPPMPKEVLVAKDKTRYLAKCKERTFGNSSSMLVKNGRAVMCNFCETIGRHEEDAYSVSNHARRNLA